MKIALCMIAGVVVCLHAYAAIMQMRTNRNNANNVLMIIGVVLAIIGIALCLANIGIDWLISLVGFAFIIFSAIQNGRKNQNFHIRHHIIRFSVFTILTIGLLYF